MGLYSNTKRITKMFCFVILGITLIILILRLTAFKDMAVTGDPEGATTPSKPAAANGGEILGSDEFPYSFNGKIYFPEANDNGNLLVQNPDSNTYLLSVDIVDNETGKSIYYTGAVEPGENIDADKMSLDGQKLENGVYECTANVAAISPNDYRVVQSQEVPVTVYIGEKPS